MAPRHQPSPQEPPQPRVSATVELPSKGKFYGSSCPDGVVELYPMTGRDEALVAGMDASDVVEVFDTLLKRCLKTPLDVDEMLSTDKFYLILCLRSNSYGAKYEFRARCPRCGLFSKTSCEVPEDFNVTWYEGDGKEPFELELPVSKRMVGYRLLRGKDERDVLRWRKREIDRGTNGPVGDPTHVYKVAKHIVSIDGQPVQNIGVAMRFFEDLIARDASAFANAIDKHASGVNTEVDATCSGCRNEFKVDMPFMAGFFRAQD